MGAVFASAANEIEASGDYPCSGKAMAINVQCSHNGQVVCVTEHAQQQVTSDWTMSHLHRALEFITGIPRQCQQFNFCGTKLQRDCTIESVVGLSVEALPDRLTLYMMVYERQNFPQQLGPFAIVDVPIAPDVFNIPDITDGLHHSGFYWEMPAALLQRHALHARAQQIVGQVSPLQSVAEDVADREELCVPKAAKTVAWSYPVDDWHSLESNAYSMDKWEDDVDCFVRLQSFLSVGGFMYFDAEDRVVGLTTVGPVQENDFGRFQFAEPRRWERDWTIALAHQGRFQTITMKSLMDAGASMYLWLRPNEVLETLEGNPLPKQPDVPYGGFAFLFHDDLFANGESVALDRYFAIEPPSSAMSSAAQSNIQSREADPLCSTQSPVPVFRSFTPIEKQMPSSLDIKVATLEHCMKHEDENDCEHCIQHEDENDCHEYYVTHGLEAYGC